MGTIQALKYKLNQSDFGTWVSGLGAGLWVVALPFAQIQQTRFTSIFLFTILGGFLISLWHKGFSSGRVPRKAFFACLPLAVFALLPLLHLGSGPESGKELVMRAPLFLIPYVLIYQSASWPTRSGWWLVVLLLVSFGFCCLFLFLQGGPGEVYRSVRQIEEEGVFFILTRPYFGYVAGTLVFLVSGYGFPCIRTAAAEVLLFLVLGGLLFIVLTKMAIFALAVSFFLYLIFQYRKKPVVLFGGLLLSVLVVGYSTHKILNSSAFKEIVSEGGIDFETVDKTYSNSINNRLILWRASLDLVKEENHWISGISADSLQSKLDAQVGRYNEYLTTRHLNAHNQFLYLVLKYGFWGGIAFLIFWISLFRSAWRKESAWRLGLWTFAFICCTTEVYLDRELGVQFFILLFFLSESPSPNPVFWKDS